MGNYIDLSNHKSGKLLAIRRDFSKNVKNTSAYWLCKCDCGNEVVVRSDAIRNKTTLSCGCIFDLEGKLFNRLRVIKKITSGKYNKPIIYQCLCSCGNTVQASSVHLRSGGVKSCGCLRRENAITIGKSLLIDLTGFISEKYNVLGFSHISKGTKYWKCKCQCGRDFTSNTYRIRHALKIDCGCGKKERYRKSKFVDLTGKIFGKLLVKHIDRFDNGWYWNCQCSCVEYTHSFWRQS